MHRSISPWAAEAKYALRTLLRIAGYPYQFLWAEDAGGGSCFDLYYGPLRAGIRSAVSIEACGISFATAPEMEPFRIYDEGGLSFLDFCQASRGGYSGSDGTMRLGNDIVFSSYWLLTGAREPGYRRDRWDNLHLNGTFFLENRLHTKPLVSLYGHLLRNFFVGLGVEPVPFPWDSGCSEAAFVFSHDVDYPQIIRWIECLRVLGRRGLRGGSTIWRVLSGENHFWKFADWVEFEKELGAHPTFYFIARQGSLFQYALGTPDGFYDIGTPEFINLFSYLRDEGCEIGLHASYNAYRDFAQLAEEKRALEKAAGVRVGGNRHHYWHVNPLAPYETLRLHEEVGFDYDTSLSFELYPGFRRGVCHPMRIFHPQERRELELIELPPTWMDDHFDRRLVQNGIYDADVFARELVEVARSTKGIVIVDYHVRGMNQDFFPRYGPWLVNFVKKNLDSSFRYYSAAQLAKEYRSYENLLERNSVDLAVETPAWEVRANIRGT